MQVAIALIFIGRVKKNSSTVYRLAGLVLAAAIQIAMSFLVCAVPRRELCRSSTRVFPFWLLVPAALCFSLQLNNIILANILQGKESGCNLSLQSQEQRK